MRFFLVLLLLFTGLPLKADTQIVKVVNLKDAQGNTLEYFHKLIYDAMNATLDMGDFVIEEVDFNVAQNRSLRLLNLPGTLDILHTMQQREWEESLIRVQQPLLDGLLGTRAFLVKAEDIDKYNNISIEQLKQQIACQGTHWRDSDILEANGYTVYRVVEFDTMVRMLAIGRCDYFPRGINEIDSDFEKFNGKYGELAKVTNLFFKYQAPVYFYVGKHNKKLADRLTEGFKRLGGNQYIKAQLAQHSQTESAKYITAPTAKIVELDAPM